MPIFRILFHFGNWFDLIRQSVKLYPRAAAGVMIKCLVGSLARFFIRLNLCLLPLPNDDCLGLISLSNSEILILPQSSGSANVLVPLVSRESRESSSDAECLTRCPIMLSPSI